MTSAHARRKQPDLIRRTLLECAARLAVEQGLGAVTVQAVAAAAGVTKGGLFHHFPNKQALLEGVFLDLLAKLDAEIEGVMARDGEPQGRFTRAYVASTFAERDRGEADLWAALSLSMLAEPSLRRPWFKWLNGRLERHRDTDGDPMHAVVRLAADGVWLSQLLHDDHGPASDLSAVNDRLVALSRVR